MQKIEKYFPHSTMQEFMATLNEETLEGVFTLRLTPAQFKKPFHLPVGCSVVDIVNWLRDLQQQDKFSKCMAFREIAPKVGEHYHIRFLTEFKTRKSLADLVKAHFPIPTGLGQGNKAYAIRDCKAKDKIIWKSATYIAKDGDCVYRHGYSFEDIKYFVEYSHKLREFRGYPKFDQIIYTYGLNNKSQAELTGKLIYDSVIQFHRRKKKEIPPFYRIRNIMHNICFKLSSLYRLGHEENLTSQFDWKLKGGSWESGSII